jgi:hypothetical protein
LKERKGTITKVFPKDVIKILKKFGYYLNCNGLPLDLMEDFFTQLYTFINFQTLNAMVKNDKYCTMGCAIQLKFAVTTLENWTVDNSFKSPNLSICRQISNILMINRDVSNDESLLKEICPSIELSFVSKILSLYHKDEYDTVAEVPQELIESLSKDQPKIEEEFELMRPKFKICEMSSWKICESIPKMLQKQEFEFLKK